MQIQGETFINKLILLFVFDKMESALSERTLVDMCSTSNDWVTYMDCVMIIGQLFEDGFICTVETNDDTLYTITPDGRSCLANFYINIPKSTREEISVFVKNNSARYRNRQECKSDFIRTRTARIRCSCAYSPPPSRCSNSNSSFPTGKRRRTFTRSGS